MSTTVEKYKIIIIVALAENRVIGDKNKLPWHIPEDLKRFKAITEGHTVIMGRKTFESIGRPLSDRFNIVLSSKMQSNAVKVARSLEDAFDAVPYDETQVFIIGGGQVYEEALQMADLMFLTIVAGNYKGDAYFPDFDEDDWEITAMTKTPEYQFVTLTRLQNESSNFK
jgi:dihydrofolate reductase